MLGLRWDPGGFLGGGRGLGALVPSLLGAAAARSGSAARWGAAARSKRGVPARAARNRRRESDPSPSLKARPGGDPAVHPTPTANTHVATATARLPRCLVQLRRCSTGAFERCIELSAIRWSPTPRPGGDPASIQRPTPNALAVHPTPKNPRTNPLRIATPTSGVLQNDLRRHLSKYLARRPRRRRPIAPNAHSQPNAQNVARASRPNAHSPPDTQRQNPNPFRSMPHSSLGANRRLRPRP